METFFIPSEMIFFSFGIEVSVGLGAPQLGHADASVETFFLHSLQGFNAVTHHIRTHWRSQYDHTKQRNSRFL